LKSTTRVALLFLVVAILYAGLGLLPGRTFVPIDIPLDADAWKPDPTQRVRVSNTLLGDVVVQFVAWDKEILRHFTRGELPWTNRLAGEGAPLFANPQTALLSPFTWPRLILGLKGGLKGWGIAAILKLLAAALCTYWLARELGIAPREAALSGVVFATSGYTIVWLLYPITNVFVWLPGLAAAALRLMKYASMRNAALVILLAALCTAGGHPETLFIGVIGVWIFLAWESEKRRDLGPIRLIPASIGALLGFLLLAVQLAPFLAILGDGYAEVLRPSMPHPFRTWAVASQVLPGILGTPLRGELDLTALPMAENFNLRAGAYIGAIVLLAILLTWRELAPVLRRGLIIGGIALFLSWYPPGLWAVSRNAPVLRVLTFEYGVALFVLFGAVAAGPAIAIAASRKRHRLGPALIIAGTLALIVGILPVVPAARNTLGRVARSGIEELRERGHLRQPPEVYEQRLDGYLSAAGLTTLRRLAIPGACWLLAGIALSVSRRRALLLSLAAAGELMAFGIGFNPAVRMTNVPPEPEVIAAIRQLDPSRQFLLAEHFEVFPANLGTIYGVRDVISYDALTTKSRVARLLPAGYDPLLHTFNPILRPEEVRELGKLGVRFVLSRHAVAGAQRTAGSPAPAVGVYEIAGVAPTPLPPNNRPAGFMVGFVISLLAALASAAWLRLFRIEAPGNAPNLARRG
jgi:hypothetical protein